MIFWARATRGLTQKNVKVKAQVERGPIRLGVFSTLNLSLGLPMRLVHCEAQPGCPLKKNRETYWIRFLRRQGAISFTASWSNVHAG